MALVGQGKVRGLFAGLDLLEALPCIVRCRIEAAFLEDILDLLTSARGDDLFAVAILLAYGLESCLVCLHML